MHAIKFCYNSKLYNIHYRSSNIRDPFMSALVDIKQEYDARRVVAAEVLASPAGQQAAQELPSTRLSNFQQ